MRPVYRSVSSSNRKTYHHTRNAICWRNRMKWINKWIDLWNGIFIVGISAISEVMNKATATTANDEYRKVIKNPHKISCAAEVFKHIAIRKNSESNWVEWSKFKCCWIPNCTSCASLMIYYQLVMYLCSTSVLRIGMNEPWTWAHTKCNLTSVGIPFIAHKPYVYC